MFQAVATVQANGGEDPVCTAEGWTVKDMGGTFMLSKASVSMNDGGKYNYSVTAGEETVTGSFKVKVGPAGAYEYDGKYPRGVAEEDAGFRANLKKVQKFKIPTKVTSGPQDIWALLKQANPREYDRLSFEWGIKDLRKLLKKLAQKNLNYF